MRSNPEPCAFAQVQPDQLEMMQEIFGSQVTPTENQLQPGVLARSARRMLQIRRPLGIGLDVLWRCLLLKGQNRPPWARTVGGVGAETLPDLSD